MSWIGKRLRRQEDHRFLAGRGQFVDDLAADGVLHGVVVRAPLAHAWLRALDLDAARAVPGVRLVLSAADLDAAGIGTLPLDLKPPGAAVPGAHPALQPVLVAEEVRFTGEAVAFVVAETREAARDGAEAVIAEYDPLPAVVTVEQALDGPDLAWAGSVTNLALRHAEGDAEAATAAFAVAAHVVGIALDVHRVEALPMEPRGCIGAFDPATGFTLQVSTQRVHLIQRALADHIFRVPRTQVRVVAPDTGGGFGQKNGLYPEYVLCLEAARRLGRLVKWIAERTESFASNNHGRDNHFRAEAALDGAGRLLAMRATRAMNLGAYTSPRSMIPVRNGLTHLTGVYRVPAAHIAVAGLLSNTACTSPYRGAGRPENVYLCERLVDRIARRLGADPVAFRRANLVRTEAMPWTSPLGTRFAGVDPGAMLERCLDLADHTGFADRRAASAARGLLRGFGVALFAEDLHGSHEPLPAHLRAEAGRLVLLVGSGSAGHGHETAFRQLAAERLGLAPEEIGFVQSDTARIPDGIGTAASWSLTLGGSSVHLAALAAIEAARGVAARLLGVPGDSVAFDAGLFRSGASNRALGWADILAAEPGFAVSAAYPGHGETLPVGCHAAEVEVDPETGIIHLLRFGVAQEAGVLLNPMLVEGQLHGGVVQGVGQGWMEAIRYDADGQLLSGSLMDYAAPRASDLPDIATTLSETVAEENPLGVKGVGEAAATGSTAAFVNAVLDALVPLGVEDIATPVTPERVWAAISAASSA